MGTADIAALIAGQVSSHTPMLLATVTSAGSTVNGQQVCSALVDGALTACTVVCPDADGYFPTIGDRLLVQRVGSQVYVLSIITQAAPPTFSQVFTGTPNATTGLLTVTHGLGRTPIGAVTTPLNPTNGGSNASIFLAALPQGPTGFTSTQMTVRCLNATPAFWTSGVQVTFSAVLM